MSKQHILEGDSADISLINLSTKQNKSHKKKKKKNHFEEVTFSLLGKGDSNYQGKLAYFISLWDIAL